MPTPQYYQNNDNNNPSKEIWANSGIYDQRSYGSSQYVSDTTNSTAPNTGISVKNQQSDPPVTYTDSSLLSAPRYTFSSGNYFIDNMDIFNPYRHYIDGIIFDPQDFLRETVNVFNVYSINYRVY